MTKSNILLLLIVIAFIMMYLPWQIGSSLWIICYYALILFSLYGIMSSKFKGGCIIILATSLCVPSGFTGDGFTYGNLAAATSAQYKIYQYIIPLIGGILLVKNKQYISNYNNLTKNIIILLFCSCIAFLSTFSINEFYSFLRGVGMSYLIYICTYRDGIPPKYYFRLIDVLFTITFLFVIVEFILHMGPYQSIYDAYIIEYGLYDAIGRAKGLLGQPLILSGIVLLYQASIFIRSLATNRKYLILELMCVSCALMTVSRTTITIMILEFAAYLYFSGAIKNTRMLFVNGSLLLVFLVTLNFWGAQYIDDLFYRIETGSAEHRFAGFETTYNVFTNNIFGIGRYNMIDQIFKSHYNAIGFSEIATFDNAYLSAICSFGVFSIFYFYYYAYFLVDAIKKKDTSPILFKSVMILYVAVLPLGFSYNWDVTIPVSCMFFSILGILYKDTEYLEMSL